LDESTSKKQCRQIRASVFYLDASYRGNSAMTTLSQVLLVEDNAADIELMRDTLASEKIDVELAVAKDGVGAIDYLHGAGASLVPQNPSLILLDLNMPRRDGRQLLATLKSQDIYRRIPAVVLSASNADTDITNCYDLGASCYIVKPDNLNDYRAVVRNLFNFWLGESGAREYIKRPSDSHALTVSGGNPIDLWLSRSQPTANYGFELNGNREWFHLTQEEKDILILMRVMDSPAAR
jgi:chemotaxis family two-component system response regulator Rcp1